jgi:hypothetical protein
MINFLEIIYTFEHNKNISGKMFKRVDCMDIPKLALLSEQAFLAFLKEVFISDYGKRLISGIIEEMLSELHFKPDFDKDLREISIKFYTEDIDNLFVPKFIEECKGKWYFENGFNIDQVVNKRSIHLTQVQLKQFSKNILRQLNQIAKHDQNYN